MSAVMSVALMYSCFQAEPTTETDANVTLSSQPITTTVANEPESIVESGTNERQSDAEAVNPSPKVQEASSDNVTTESVTTPKEKPSTKLNTNEVPRTITNDAPAPPKSEPFPDEEAAEPQGSSEPFPDEENPRTVDLPSKDIPQATKVIDSKPNFALSHDKFDALLRRYVSSSGKVDYKSFKKEQSELEAYISLLQNNAPKSDWSKNKEMAYWINLYNAFTIQTILEEYPVKSIMDIDGGKVWDKRTISVGGKSYTLNDIEKKQLLKRFREPRVHFAVNCAAASCPPLLNKAWTEENIQRYMSKQARAFINNSTHNSLSANSVQLSQIFNWYADDFGGKDKVLSYIQKYSSTEINKNAKVSFKTYNWSLNN